MLEPRLFPVQVRSDRFRPMHHGQIVFHGINKSGSLALSDVLRRGYKEAARLNQFFSHYRGIPKQQSDLFEIIEHASGHAFFVGHNLYGAMSPSPQRALVTILRHPLPRIFSVYRWLEKHHAKDYGGTMPSFVDWVERTKGTSYSQFEQFGAGFGPDMAKLRKLPANELLERAKQALLQDVHCIGLAERFEETIFLFAHLCGLPAVPSWKRDERNNDRPLIDTIDKKLISLVEEVFHRDFEFYQFGVSLFEKQLSETIFDSALDEYKDACINEYKDRVLI